MKKIANRCNKYFILISARDKADNKKLFGFSFARLMELEGAILPVKNKFMLMFGACSNIFPVSDFQ